MIGAAPKKLQRRPVEQDLALRLLQKAIAEIRTTSFLSSAKSTDRIFELADAVHQLPDMIRNPESTTFLWENLREIKAVVDKGAGEG